MRHVSKLPYGDAGTAVTSAFILATFQTASVLYLNGPFPYSSILRVSRRIQATGGEYSKLARLIINLS